MESGSLLGEALRHMEAQRQLEDEDYFSTGLISGGVNDCVVGAGDQQQDLTRNAVIVSVYPLDSLDDCSISKSTDNSGDKRKRRRLLRKVALLGDTLNRSILSKINYPWHMGGDGLVFGAECQSVDGSRAIDDGDNALPHLRGVLRYGHCLADEWFVVALMLHVANVLQSEFQLRVAIELLDADDGQFLLIEAADSLPPWVDDLGVEGMTNRTWIYDRSFRIIRPSVDDAAGSSAKRISKSQALKSLVSQASGTAAPSEVHKALMAKIDPCLEVIHGLSSNKVPRALRGEQLHRTAVVLPLNIAILCRERPDLIPAAIHSFCRNEGNDSNTPKKRIGSSPNNDASDHDLLRFERLVTTVISLSRTTYACLLTGDGMITPPFAVPKEYRSVEFNRMRRKLQGEALTDRFRHSLEAGVRLARGFECLIVGRGSCDETRSRNNKSGCEHYSFDDREQHICTHWARLTMESGADHSWIKDAWKAGPNGSQDTASCIDAFLKCPVYRPEISRGGLWPLSHQCRPAREIARDALHQAGRSSLTAADFPTTREEDVDGDKWLDLDSLGNAHQLMQEIASGSSIQSSDAANGQTLNVDRMLDRLQCFVQTKSDFDGVNTKQAIELKKKETSGPTHRSILSTSGSEYDFNIDPKAFVNILHRSLKEASRDSENASMPLEQEMHLFFYREADGEDSESNASSRIDFDNESLLSMQEEMAAMDAELRGSNVDREKDYSIDTPNEVGETTEAVSSETTAQLSEEFGVVSNLLRSLEMGDGSGATSNLLKDLGLDPTRRQIF